MITEETATKLLQTIEAQMKLIGTVMEGLSILTNTVAMQGRQINELQEKP